MSNNGKDIKRALKAAAETPKKPNPYKHDVIYDPRGQWAFPGQVTKVPSSNITMQGVPYPVLGVDNYGNEQMMQPGMDYTFPGQYVTEYPMAAYGGDPSLPAITGHYQKGGWLDEYFRGGSGPMTHPKLKKKARQQGTSKNIQSSINKLFLRNYTIFGPSGRNIYNPKSKYESGGGWLDAYQNAGSTGVKKPHVLSPTELAQAQAYDEQKKYEASLSKDQKLALLSMKANDEREPDILRATEKQGMGSKIWEVINNPMTAATNLYQHGYLPDNFSQGPSNYLDLPISLHNPAFYAEAAYNTGKAAVDPETYKNLAKTVRAGAHGAVGAPVSQEDAMAAANTLGVLIDAGFARSAGKKVKKVLNKNLEKTVNNVRKGMAEQAKLASKKPIPVGKMEGVGSAKDAVLKKSYGELATPVYEGKYPASTTSGNIKGDLFDLKQTGYTDVPGFNKELQQLKAQSEFGKKPLLTKEDFYSHKEVQDAIAKRDVYNKTMLEYARNAMESGNPIDYENFRNLYPNVNFPYLEDKYSFIPSIMKENKAVSNLGRKAYSNTLNTQGYLDDISKKNKSYKGKEAFKTLSPNKYGGSPRGWLDNLD